MPIKKIINIYKILLSVKKTDYNKVMHLSAMAYNLKKYLKFIQKRIKSGAGMLPLIRFIKMACREANTLLLSVFKNPEIVIL